jgi:hypothetical protein
VEAHLHQIRAVTQQYRGLVEKLLAMRPASRPRAGASCEERAALLSANASPSAVRAGGARARVAVPAPPGAPAPLGGGSACTPTPQWCCSAKKSCGLCSGVSAARWRLVPLRRRRVGGQVVNTEALAVLKAGGKVTRARWDGSWLGLQRPDEHSRMTGPYLYLGNAADTTPVLSLPVQFVFQYPAVFVLSSGLRIHVRYNLCFRNHSRVY